MEKVKQALEAVQHIFLCEDEGMASGQPTKEDYLQARELVAVALAELEGPKPQPQDPDANTRAVSIDQIMDKVASWESTWAMDPPAETPEGLRGMWNDLRQRLENIKPSNPDQ